jgi:hypothetical protein
MDGQVPLLQFDEESVFIDLLVKAGAKRVR